MGGFGHGGVELKITEQPIPKWVEGMPQDLVGVTQGPQRTGAVFEMQVLHFIDQATLANARITPDNGHTGKLAVPQRQHAIDKTWQLQFAAHEFAGMEQLLLFAPGERIDLLLGRKALEILCTLIFEIKTILYTAGDAFIHPDLAISRSHHEA